MKKLYAFALVLTLVSMAMVSAVAVDSNHDGKISLGEWFKGIFTGNVVGEPVDCNVVPASTDLMENFLANCFDEVDVHNLNMNN